MKDLQLHCPECGIALERTHDAVRCPRCGMSAPYVDGVPHFIDDDFYWGEIPQGVMQGIVADMAEKPWQDVLDGSEDPAVKAASAFIQNVSRGNFHYLAGMPADAAVLDLGAGTGTVSQALSGYFDQVIAVEPVRERIDFCRHRFAQEGCANITLLRSNIDTLPFSEERFDLIVMNGILEWLGLSREAGSVTAIQRAALARLHSLLKPGGKLYIGIENRLGMDFFSGRIDHSYLPYTSIMPRWMADIVTRLRKGHPYRTYTYTKFGLTKLLRSTGFENMAFYHPYPGYNDPRHAVALSGNVLSDYFINGRTARNAFKSFIRNVLVKSGLFAYVTPDYLVFSQKPGASRRSKIFTAAASRYGNGQNVGTYEYRMQNTSAKHITLLCYPPGCDEPELSVAVALDAEAGAFVKAESDALREIDTFLQGGLRQSVPHSIEIGTAEGKAFHIRSTVKGQAFPVSTDVQTAFGNLQRVGRWYEKYTKCALQGSGRAINLSEAEEYAESVLQSLPANIGNDETFKKWLAENARSLADSGAMSFPQHGDFWHGNVLLDGNHVNVFDWEAYGRIRLPLSDPFVFVTMYLTDSCHGGPGRRSRMETAVRNGSYGKMVNAVVGPAASGLGLGNELLPFMHIAALAAFYSDIAVPLLGHEVIAETGSLIEYLAANRMSLGNYL